MLETFSSLFCFEIYSKQFFTKLLPISIVDLASCDKEFRKFYQSCISSVLVFITLLLIIFIFFLLESSFFLLPKYASTLCNIFLCV